MTRVPFVGQTGLDRMRMGGGLGGQARARRAPRSPCGSNDSLVEASERVADGLPEGAVDALGDAYVRTRELSGELASRIASGPPKPNLGGLVSRLAPGVPKPRQLGEAPCPVLGPTSEEPHANYRVTGVKYGCRMR